MRRGGGRQSTRQEPLFSGASQIKHFVNNKLDTCWFARVAAGSMRAGRHLLRFKRRGSSIMKRSAPMSCWARECFVAARGLRSPDLVEGDSRRQLPPVSAVLEHDLLASVAGGSGPRRGGERGAVGARGGAVRIASREQTVAGRSDEPGEAVARDSRCRADVAAPRDQRHRRLAPHRAGPGAAGGGGRRGGRGGSARVLQPGARPGDGAARVGAPRESRGSCASSPAPKPRRPSTTTPARRSWP